MEHTVVTDYTSSTNTGNENIKVYVRARPLENGEDPPADMWKFSSDIDQHGKLTIRDPGRHLAQHDFLFDKIFWTETTQEQLFNEVAKPVLEHCLKGRNGCCFAYGQTGSGKTYSMFGGEYEQRGLIPRAVEFIFDAITKDRDNSVRVVVSFLEMYCGEIRDLGRAYLDKKTKPGSANKTNTSEWYMKKVKNLSSRAFIGSPLQSPSKSSFKANLEASPRGPTQSSPKQVDYYGDGTGLLSINEDIDGNVYVKDLTELQVTTAAEVIDIVKEGFKIRATHETKMNAVSSRSHTVFKITVLRKDPISGDDISGTINMVDLAGSERLNKSESEGQRLRETLSINTSLSALGKVAMALSGNEAFVPYRDSKLTRLLQSSLGGNSHTSVITALHPTVGNYEECLNTMQFANRCRNVINMPRINYTDKSKSDKHKIRRLKQEIQRLRMLIRIIIDKKNAQIAELMANLGVGGEVLPDGRVKLQDGVIIGQALDMSKVEEEASEMLNEAKTSSEGEPLAEAMESMSKSARDLRDTSESSMKVTSGKAIKVGGEGVIVPGGISLGVAVGKNALMEKINLAQEASTLKSQLKAERQESKRMREKLEQLDTTITALRKERQAELKRQERSSAKERDARHELATTLQATRQTHATELQRLEEHYEIEIQNVLNHTKRLQRRHAEEMWRCMGRTHSRSTPNLRNPSGTAGRIQGRDGATYDGLEREGREGVGDSNATEDMRDQLERDHIAHIKQIIASSAVHEENLKQQYSYWINEKEQQLERFIRDFNEYHKYRTEEIVGLKSEHALLHEYCVKLSVVLEKVENGEYPLRAFQRSSIHRVCIPPAHKPDEALLQDPNRLTNLQQEISKVQNFIEKYSSRQPDESKENQVDPVGKNLAGEEGTNRQETTADDMVRSQGQGLEIMSLSKDELQKGSKEEAIEKLMQLQVYVESGIRPQMENELTEALQSNQTMEYIKSLEQDLDKSKRQLEEEMDRHKKLRIAFNSQQRMLRSRTMGAKLRQLNRETRHVSSTSALPKFRHDTENQNQGAIPDNTPAKHSRTTRSGLYLSNSGSTRKNRPQSARPSR